VLIFVLGREEKTLLPRRAEYPARMRRKYERGAARPWEFVAPDLPPP
jgi:hypothetical protein